MSRRKQGSKYELLMARHSLIPALTFSQGFHKDAVQQIVFLGVEREGKKEFVDCFLSPIFQSLSCHRANSLAFYLVCPWSHASATGWRLRDTVMGMVRRRQTMLKETWKIRIVTLGRVSLWTARQGCGSGCLINRIQTTVFKKFREYKGTHHPDSEEDENWSHCGFLYMFFPCKPSFLFPFH